MTKETSKRPRGHENDLGHIRVSDRGLLNDLTEEISE
jgi:hypothetical protein